MAEPGRFSELAHANPGAKHDRELMSKCDAAPRPGKERHAKLVPLEKAAGVVFTAAHQPDLGPLKEKRDRWPRPGMDMQDGGHSRKMPPDGKVQRLRRQPRPCRLSA
jgi:hypothetical protein